MNIKCATCKTDRPTSNYIKRSDRTGQNPKCATCRKQYNSYCKVRKYGSETTANRAYNLWNKYKLTIKDYEALVTQQNRKCKICESVPSKLVVDHCHVTGMVRGLLCNPCNVIVGKFGDDIAGIKKVLTYLQGEP